MDAIEPFTGGTPKGKLAVSKSPSKKIVLKRVPPPPLPEN